MKFSPHAKKGDVKVTKVKQLERELMKYPDKWVAVCNNKVIATANSLRAIYKKLSAEDRKKKPLITKVTAEDEDILIA